MGGRWKAVSSDHWRLTGLADRSPSLLGRGGLHQSIAATTPHNWIRTEEFHSTPYPIARGAGGGGLAAERRLQIHASTRGGRKTILVALAIMTDEIDHHRGGKQEHRILVTGDLDAISVRP